MDGYQSGLCGGKVDRHRAVCINFCHPYVTNIAADAFRDISASKRMARTMDPYKERPTSSVNQSLEYSLGLVKSRSMTGKETWRKSSSADREVVLFLEDLSL
jgi:hypothetical protein